MRSVSKIVAITLLLGVVWWLMPPRQYGPPATKFMRCSNNLKLIGIALHAYRDDHGRFPPAFLADKAGNPAHSWRVLILPYLNHQGLYDSYRFDERWNGPHNSQLASSMPLAYRCPSFVATDLQDQDTNYLAIVAPDSVMSGATAVDMVPITDRQPGPILVTESTVRTVHWMSPHDLATNELFADLQAGLCPHTNGVNVLRADGAVNFLPQHITIDELRGLVSCEGGNNVIELDSHP